MANSKKKKKGKKNIVWNIKVDKLTCIILLYFMANSKKKKKGKKNIVWNIKVDKLTCIIVSRKTLKIQYPWLQLLAVWLLQTIS